MEKKRLEIISFLVFCAGVFTMTFYVFRPFFSILVLATVLSLLFRPLYKRMLDHYARGKNLFAFIIVIMALIFLIIPILLFMFQILEQMQIFFTIVQNSHGHHMQVLKNTVESFVHNVLPNFTFDISNYASMMVTFVSDNFGALISRTAYIFFYIFFLLLTFFFFLRDGKQIFSSVISLSPFEKEQNKEITASMHSTVTSVINGTLLVGLIRLIIMVIGFYFLGIPNAVLWGSVAGFIGVIPGLGTAFAIIPAMIYLVLVGNLILAIGMGILGILIFFFLDNMLSAYYFGKGLDVPPIFMLFSILGGVIFFGPLGFIFGPIILSLYVSVIEMYKILILKKRTEK